LSNGTTISEIRFHSNISSILKAFFLINPVFFSLVIVIFWTLAVALINKVDQNVWKSLRVIQIE